MASYRARANAGGLPVAGTVIHPAPVVARPEPPSGAAAESEKLDYWGRVSEYQSYLRSIDLYATLQNRTHRTFERLDDWVADNLVGSEADLQVPGLTAAMGLAAPVVNYALDFGSTAYDHRAEQLVEQAQRHAVESAARASGNPEVRAGYLPPRELAVERRLARSGTMAAAERFGRVGRVLGTVGMVVTGAVSVHELAAGASPSGVGISVVSGVVGSMIGVAVFAGVAATPAIVVAGAAVVTAIAVSSVADWIWQEVVPQHMRDKVDEGLQDAWIDATSWLSSP